MRRSFASVPTAWLLFACTAAEPPTTDPIHEGAPPSARLESEPNPVSTTDGPEYFFAVASQVGVEHCPKGEFEWLAV